jgi:hypothetical protein
VEAMIVLGHPGNKAELSESLQNREKPSDRRPLSETICEGPFSL